MGSHGDDLLSGEDDYLPNSGEKQVIPGPVVLVIIDGWGLSPPGPGNAIHRARTPNMDRCMAVFPFLELGASGGAVGLPEGRMGNSEVGHLNIGAGRMISSPLTLIDIEIQSGAFYRNPVLTGELEALRARDPTPCGRPALHLIGLLSDGGVHSHMAHLEAILETARGMGIARVFIHAILDGRDTPPHSALDYVHRLEYFIREKKMDGGNEPGGSGARIATVTGRYYAMDRDHKWERTREAYETIVTHRGSFSSRSAFDAVDAAYRRGESDEFVKPTSISLGSRGYGFDPVNDLVLFFNFRPDRARQLTHALSDVEFEEFPRPVGPCRHMLTMRQYEEGLKVRVIFPPLIVRDTLGAAVAKAGKRQLRVAETEKYAHVTFFLNGGEERPFPGEDRILIPSPRVATYDLKPEMSAGEVCAVVLRSLEEEKYDLIVVNFANPDMVGHTGIMEAAVKAVETVDRCVGKIVDTALARDGAVLITADHGNADRVEDEEGKPFTAHTTSPVPLILANRQGCALRRPEDGVTTAAITDVAPLVLELMGIEPPAVMNSGKLLEWPDPGRRAKPPTRPANRKPPV